MIHVCQIQRPAENPSSSYYYSAYSCLLLINLVENIRLLSVQAQRFIYLVLRPHKYSERGQLRKKELLERSFDVQSGDYSIFVQIVIGDPPHSISSSKSFSIQIILGSYGL
jgi:hypothetical protein